MPYGRTKDEQKWFRGWFEVVVEPAVNESGYEPVLAATQERPNAINDEIRAHLALDPMVVVDLGGASPDEPPNPNVMYELGIRHAFGLPMVIMAWEGQSLPFDIANQRAIVGGRDLVDLGQTRKKLKTFIKAAADGEFYKPMDAVARAVQLDATSYELGEDSLLKVLADEVRALRQSVLVRGPGPPRVRRIRNILSDRETKALVRNLAAEMGFDVSSWSAFLRGIVSERDEERMRQWEPQQWQRYLAMRAVTLLSDASRKGQPLKAVSPTSDLDGKVEQLLPAQPWPTGVHKVIADRLGVPNSKVSKSIERLIAAGKFRDQVDGKILEQPAPADDGQGTPLETK